MSDQQLAIAVQGGDRRAAQLLMERYQDGLFGLALRLLRNREDAAEVAQEAMVKALARIETYDASRPFSPWVYRIARNLCIDRHRKKRPALEIDEQRDAAPALDIGDNPKFQTTMGYSIYLLLTKDGQMDKKADSPFMIGHSCVVSILCSARDADDLIPFHSTAVLDLPLLTRSYEYPLDPTKETQPSTVIHSKVGHGWASRNLVVFRWLFNNNFVNNVDVDRLWWRPKMFTTFMNSTQKRFNT